MASQIDEGHFKMEKNRLVEAIPVHGGQSAGLLRRYIKEKAQQSFMKGKDVYVRIFTYKISGRLWRRSKFEKEF